MGELGGFLKIERVGVLYDDPTQRIEGDQTFKEFLVRRPDDELAAQGARCMECGVPFCHNGCPLGNLIPDWNDLVYRDKWHDAILQLHATNNFPEFTGRLCPAPCEAACVLEINEGDAVTIKQIENAIIDRAWDEGWVAPAAAAASRPAAASPSSAPARPGMAAAQQLRRVGHRVVLFERDEAGGRARALRRAGLQDREARDRAPRRADERGGRRAALRRRRRASTSPPTSCAREFDAVVLAIGSRVPRDLPVPGRELDGVHFAMDYLYVRNRAVARLGGPLRSRAKGKHVVVIGGGDTGADCVGNSIREGAASVVQLELLPEPPRQAPRRPHAVAAVAAEVPPQLRDGGGEGGRPRRAGLLGRHDALRGRRRRPRAHAALRAGRARAAVQAGRGHRGRAARRPRAARDGLPAPASTTAWSTSSASRRTSAAT